MHSLKKLFRGTLTGALLLTTSVASASPVFPDGLVVKGSGDPVYIVEGGARRWIPNPQTFDAMCLSWEQITVISDEQLGTIPLGEQIPYDVAPRYPVTHYQYERVKEGGHMETTVTLSNNGRLDAVTRTWNRVMLKGFTGGVVVVLTDDCGNRVWVSDLQTYGVDGTLIGAHDRTMPWSADVPTDAFVRARNISILQVHAPTPRWRSWLEAAADAAGTIANVAVTIKSLQPTPSAP